MEYNLETYRQWLRDNLRLSNAFTIESLKEITHHILMGRNYRLITENNTKSKLIYTYAWLTDIVKNAKEEFGDNWKSGLLNDLINTRRKTTEQKKLMFWLLGLTSKTYSNLNVSYDEIPDVLDQLIEHVTNIHQEIDRIDKIDDTWLLMMAGTATLNIRGSDKSSIGKTLERVLVKAILTILGFQHEVNFWTNIQRDIQVDRETDAEIETARTRIRMEVGLISSGNQEVTEDKITRVGRNGIILFDKIGAKSRVGATADRYMVKLVQIRNNQPLVEVYRHLSKLVNINLNNPPQTDEEIRQAVNNLPDSVFNIN